MSENREYVVESFKIIGWKAKEVGLVLQENEEWILINHIPEDYLVDGFMLIRKSYVKSRKSKSKQKRIEKVLSLKSYNPVHPPSFSFLEVIPMLEWCEHRYGLIQFQDEDQDEVAIGKIDSILGNDLVIDMVGIDGTLDPDYDFQYQIDQIRAISFDSNYFQSIRLLMNDHFEKLASK